MTYITGKIFLAYLFFVLLATSAANILLMRFLESLLLTNARQSLQEKWVDSYQALQGLRLSSDRSEAIRQKLVDLSQGSSYQLSLYTLDGKPVADSAMAAAEFQSAAVPPDVSQALRNGQAFDLNEPGEVPPERLAFSKLTEDTVFRVGMSVEPVYQLLGRIRFFIWTATAVLLGLSWLFYFTLVRRIDEAFSRFKKMVRGFEQGNYNQRFPVVRDDGVSEIGQSMNSLARELERKIRALAEERNRFKTILDAMQEGVIVLDAEGNISLFNPAMRQLFGLQDEDLGRAPIEVIRNADLQSIVEESLKGKPIANQEIRVYRDGRERYLLVQATGFWEDSVAAMGAIVVLYDITNLRHLERVRRDFVANVSHELKTPLTSIRGYVETLLDSGPQLNEQSRNFLGVIETNTHRLGKLVEDLLRLSEIESQQFVLKPEVFRVQELFGEVLDLHDSLLKKKAMTVDVSIEPENLELYADRMALLHMLNNLVENAIKYGYPDTIIQLQCRNEGGIAVFRVQDRGIGIAASHLERIFERFYRVDKSRSKQEGSTGLGLSIVKHLVQLMGGEITVESQEEQGSTFIFRLPKSVAAELAEPLAK